ncbi:MAG: tRNA dihydrouridine synthase DusB [Actinomycetales bacterium]|nr:tRNA dihydrouridine synthase DusB [Actinomycetales bacterium]
MDVVPLRIGPIDVATPVVLAPMAGITNRAFRRLCREWALGGHPAAPGAGQCTGADAGQDPGRGRRPGLAADAGVFVSEMVTSRALLERNEESLRLITHDPDEHPRSVQLYGVDPDIVGSAVRMLLAEGRADHVDLNFGCPVPKVTRKGGGSALPWKSGLFARVVGSAVRAAEPHGVPVTVKMRKGIDADHLTYLDAGRIAEAEGAAAVALHARTAADYYSGTADWSAVARLKEVVTTVPVLGNGDVWSADDAVRMVAETGCDGVVVGRGCLGRPWLFADLVAGMAGRPERVRPSLGEVLATMRRHVVLLVGYYATDVGAGEAAGPALAEQRACRDIRKHVAWYLKGYVVGHEVRARLALVSSLAEFDEVVAGLDVAQPYPGSPAEGQRGRGGASRRVTLPDGWLDSREIEGSQAVDLAYAELPASGG